MEYGNNTAQIQVKDLSVIYNKGQTNEVRSLDDVSLQIYPHEYLIVYGPSGCGKSTLLYSIAGLQRPTAGVVEVDGSDINKLSKHDFVEFHRRKTGMIFQAFYLIPTLNIFDNVCLPKTFTRDDAKERKTAAMQLLERFGIEAQADKFPNALSGGQKQRVAIARALVNNPQIILADEPVGNLDSKSSANVMAILQELNEIDQKTVILVTHDPTHLRFGDRIIHMRDGKIIKEEIVRDKRPASVIKDEKPHEDIPPDLELLRRSFKNFTPEQLGVLLIPFKAEQLLKHIVFELTDEQIEGAKKKLENLMYSRLNFSDFVKSLDQDLKDGGAGWDKRKAVSFAMRVARTLDQANSMDLTKTEEAAKEMATYLTNYFSLGLDEAREKIFTKLIELRIKNQMSVEGIRMSLDFPAKDGGVGLDKRTAKRIAREIEILMLLKYSA